MKTTILSTALVLMLAPVVQAASPAPVTAIKGLDPVALCSGKEVAGKAEIESVRGRFRYLFSTAENKAIFEKAPERFGIQMGGACARMGPLSGLGSPDRFAVHDGRVYVFASEQCRNAFLASPARFIDTIDDAPEGTAEQAARGRALLEKAVAGVGGAQILDSLTNVQWHWKIVYQEKDKTTEGKRVITLAFDGRFREEETWDDWKCGHVFTTKGGFRFDSKSSSELDHNEREYLAAEIRRYPLVLLKQRKDPGLRAVAEGEGKIGPLAVAKLRIALRGTAATWSIDPATGRIVQIQYRGRVGGAIGDVVQTFSDFRTEKGLTVPFATVVVLDGKPITQPVATLEKLIVNGDIDPTKFVITK